MKILILLTLLLSFVFAYDRSLKELKISSLNLVIIFLSNFLALFLVWTWYASSDIIMLKFFVALGAGIFSLVGTKASIDRAKSQKSN